ncbi:DUF3275 family protein [Pseudomonas sp. MYb185]|uniref:DUF3275 family protein n=1 Tax=Pseudomonas sp. MYb185 TaxID=1848729 RepID=UPI000CFB01AF|nr:DUF3275 family protein [Pseudomonas sp. MYb185]PRB81543.1 hypothetical protein CQ007_10380 [Pseudomonas sp. MYb185]
MINIPGQLAIRTIHGRNGAFNVARLLTSIGEFAVKDPILEQYTEGKYEGSFVIAHIGPSKPYLTGSGRIVIEAPKAKIDSMVLNDMDALSQDDTERLDQKEVDPLEEEVPAVPATSPSDVGDAPFGMPSSEPAPRASPAPTNEDEALFSTLWPLGDSVKLDPTVDRQRMRAQCVRLGQLGYKLDFKQQIWERDS